MVRLQGTKLATDGCALLYDVPSEHRHLAIPMHPQPLFNDIIVRTKTWETNCSQLLSRRKETLWLNGSTMIQMTKAPSVAGNA